MTLQNIPADAYHATQALSASGVVALLRSPAHYRHEREHPRAPTPAMALGTAIHCAVLEHARFSETYAELPDVSLATKEGKAAKAAIEEAGKLPLKPADYAACIEIGCECLAHPDLGPLLVAEDAECEGSLLWDAYGVDAKCRPDLWVPSARTIVDLKTTEDARPEAFARTIAGLAYHVRAAWYLDGMQRLVDAPIRWLWAAIERDPPYGIAVYEADPEDLRAGWLACERAICAYLRCVETDKWPAYEAGITTIRRPAWAARGDQADE